MWRRHRTAAERPRRPRGDRPRAQPGDGSTHIYLRQTYQGLSVYNAQLHVNVNRDGRILGVNNQFVPAIAAAVTAIVPDLDVTQAVASTAAHLGLVFSRQG